jgi:hypothetical protein
VKLSIVILVWNDLRVIAACLRSIYAGTRLTDFEVIVSDNGSTDGSVQFIREAYPQVRVIENGTNLRFSKGNNIGIQASTGEYVLILNPDTIVHEGALDRWIQVADWHAECGAFGCRVLNADGSYQGPARPFPSVWHDLIGALCLRWLGFLSDAFLSDTYVGWNGDTERTVDWQSGCCVMFRGDLLRRLGGFDEQFLFYYEDVDLCRRVWKARYPILYTPDVTITHLGGQSTLHAPRFFELEKYRNRYRYFYKHYGRQGVRRCRLVTLTSLLARCLGYGLLQFAKPDSGRAHRLALYQMAIRWNLTVDPVRLIEHGEEPAFEQTSRRSEGSCPPLREE